MFSLLRARWGKVNSLGIWRMKGVLLWLRTKCNGSLSFLSQTCTGLFVGELDHAISCLWAFWVGTFTSLCRNPNSSCILAQQTEISLLPCAIYFPNQLEPAVPPNLSKPAIKRRCYIFTLPSFFFLGWKWRFWGSFSSEPAQLYQDDQRGDCDLHSREAKDKVLKMLSALPKTKWECGHCPLNTLLFLKKAFLYKRKGLVQSTLRSKAKHLQPFL